MRHFPTRLYTKLIAD